MYTKTITSATYVIRVKTTLGITFDLRQRPRDICVLVESTLRSLSIDFIRSRLSCRKSSLGLSSLEEKNIWDLELDNICTIEWTFDRVQINTMFAEPWLLTLLCALLGIVLLGLVTVSFSSRGQSLLCTLTLSLPPITATARPIQWLSESLIHSPSHYNYITLNLDQVQLIQ